LENLLFQQNGLKILFGIVSNEYTLEKMLELHKKRYPYTHDRTLLIEQFTNFDAAEGDFEPDCLRGNYWEL